MPVICASFVNRRFGLGLAGPGIYLVAGAVGAARTVDDAHWTSDTFAGMAYGYSVGTAVAARSSARAAERGMQPLFNLSWRVNF